MKKLILLTFLLTATMTNAQESASLKIKEAPIERVDRMPVVFENQDSCRNSGRTHVQCQRTDAESLRHAFSGKGIRHAGI